MLDITIHTVYQEPVSDNLEITTSVVLSCGGSKGLPVHRFDAVLFTCSGSLGL